MLLSRWWKWWAGLWSVFGWLTASSAELVWPTVQPIVEAHLSQAPYLESLSGTSDGQPAYEYAFVREDYGNSISPPEGETALNGFSARTGLASGSSDAVEDHQDEAIAAEVSGRSPDASPRFISQFAEWYKGKEKQKEKEKEKEVKEDNDNYHVIISHHAAQTHHSDHHSSHHGDHHGHYGYGHGHGHGHGHYHHDHDHYHHDHGHGHGYGHGHYSHGHYDHGPYGYGHQGSHSNIHIYGYPYHQYQGGHPSYYPHPYPYPYPYYAPAPSNHHHHEPQPVVQPIIIGAGGGGGGGGGKGRGKNKGKLIILNTSSTGGQVSTQGNYAAGFRYIS
ncbi:uncharacterized protein [Macrobrachium rosenbergii]|uniref:uncharacterized protein n=1 Tax=Macrobrachium rosenbergii TaxID=79674 RepID=UPI0034D457EB